MNKKSIINTLYRPGSSLALSCPVYFCTGAFVDTPVLNYEIITIIFLNYDDLNVATMILIHEINVNTCTSII